MICQTRDIHSLQGSKWRISQQSNLLPTRKYDLSSNRYIRFCTLVKRLKQINCQQSVAGGFLTATAPGWWQIIDWSFASVQKVCICWVTDHTFGCWQQVWLLAARFFIWVFDNVHISFVTDHVLSCLTGTISYGHILIWIFVTCVDKMCPVGWQVILLVGWQLLDKIPDWWKSFFINVPFGWQIIHFVAWQQIWFLDIVFVWVFDKCTDKLCRSILLYLLLGTDWMVTLQTDWVVVWQIDWMISWQTDTD